MTTIRNQPCSELTTICETQPAGNLAGIQESNKCTTRNPLQIYMSPKLDLDCTSSHEQIEDNDRCIPDIIEQLHQLQAQVASEISLVKKDRKEDHEKILKFQKDLNDYEKELINSPRLAMHSTKDIVSRLVSYLIDSKIFKLSDFFIQMKESNFTTNIIEQVIINIDERDTGRYEGTMDNPEEYLLSFLKNYAAGKSKIQLSEFLLRILKKAKPKIESIKTWLEAIEVTESGVTKNGSQLVAAAFDNFFALELKQQHLTKMESSPNSVCEYYLSPVFEGYEAITTLTEPPGLTEFRAALYRLKDTGIAPKLLCANVEAALQNNYQELNVKLHKTINEVFYQNSNTDKLPNFVPNLYDMLAEPAASNEGIEVYKQYLKDWEEGELQAANGVTANQRPASYIESLQTTFNANGTVEQIESELEACFELANESFVTAIRDYYGDNPPKELPLLPGINETNNFRDLLKLLCYPEIYGELYGDTEMPYKVVRFAARYKIMAALKARTIKASPKSATLPKYAKALNEQFWQKLLDPNIQTIQIPYIINNNGEITKVNKDYQAKPNEEINYHKLYKTTITGRPSLTSPKISIPVYFDAEEPSTLAGAPNIARIKSLPSIFLKMMKEKYGDMESLTDLIRQRFICTPENLEDLGEILTTESTSDGVEIKSQRKFNNASTKGFKSIKMRPRVAVKVGYIDENGETQTRTLYTPPSEISLFTLQQYLDSNVHGAAREHRNYRHKRAGSNIQEIFPPELFPGLYTRVLDEELNTIYVPRVPKQFLHLYSELPYYAQLAKTAL